MSTTPPEQGGPTTTTTTTPGRTAYGALPGTTDFARLPLPGNAEFAVYVAASALLALVALIADSVDTQFWVTAFSALTFAYLISRGIAKASRVLEQ